MIIEKRALAAVQMDFWIAASAFVLNSGGIDKWTTQEYTCL
jgi:hypothetical protein